MDFDCPTLSAASWGQGLIQVMSAALQAVDPYQVVTKYIEKLNLSAAGRIFVVGAGKAGLPMAQAAADHFGDRITAGQVTVKDGYGGKAQVGNITIVEAGHPLPDQRGVESTQQILALLADTTPDDLVICLISGGGSALLTAPVVPLDDLRTLTDQLLASGANINEINTLRKQLDPVKGGGLARAAHPAQVLTLILSDVVGDPLDVIASGPTVPNPDIPQDSLEAIAKYALADKIPSSVVDVLTQSKLQASALPMQISRPLDIKTTRLQNILVGNNETAAQAALDRAKQLGYTTRPLTTTLEGEARQVGKEMANTLLAVERSDPHPFLWLAGGETTVTLQGNGVGGRNQELALAAVEPLAGVENIALVTLATDGGDGPTHAAGAVVTGETLKRARELDLDPQKYLANNDSYNFFRPLGSLLKPGPTQTNVNDLVFLVGY